MPTRIDWFRILDDLKRHGFSLYALEDLVAIPKSTLQGYRLGSRPRYEDGERLILFWCQVTTKSPEEVPREAVVLSVAQASRI